MDEITRGALKKSQLNTASMNTLKFRSRAKFFYKLTSIIATE